MQSFVRLRKTGSGWEFESEIALEDFVWANLQQLLGLIPLKRQYRVNSQICDIVAIDENKRLVVLELKNCEDRYVVQQLTRYYDALLEEKAFNEEIDYGQPVRLVAIAPSFHKDNFTDRKYHKLVFEFILFQLIQEGNLLYFNLNNLNGLQVSRLKVSYPEKYITASSDNLPQPKPIPRIPKLLNKIIETQTSEKYNKILRIREKILHFDERMGEKNTTVTIVYGKDKGKRQLCKSPSKLCAGFHIYKELSSPDSSVIPNSIELFLYLPFPKKTVSKGIMKIQIKTDDWQTVSAVRLPYRYGYYHANINTGLVDIETYLNIYEKITGKPVKSNSLDTLVDIALEEWLERL